ncbi:MAG: hypothetical protein CMJ58_00155 [Planctomycetaceae bacterium]|nr:hypothetical protein [Planctomycetaceae bacterium]
MEWLQQPHGRSVRCNGDALRRLRTRRHWTQPELASLAGFTTRLIAKAEAGGALSPSTLEVLAETLSTAQHPVFPEDLAFWPKAAARHIVESFAKHERQCAARCHQLLAPDIRVTAPGDPAVFPFAGVRDTIDGFDDFWRQYFAVMQRFDKLQIVRTLRLVAEDNLVVALAHEGATYKGWQDTDAGCPIAFVFEFHRGRLASFEDHFDAATAAAKVAEHRRRHG